MSVAELRVYIRSDEPCVLYTLKLLLYSCSGTCNERSQTRMALPARKASSRSHPPLVYHSLDHSLSASPNPSSPSTSTHQPSPPPPPSPPIAALKFALAYSSTSRSKLPGCNHTAGIPASFASSSNCLVTAGGVITDSEYDAAGGSRSALGDGTVAWSRSRMFTLDARGFMGVAGSEC